MATIRITTQGSQGRLGLAALPVPARDGKAYQDRGTLHGAPGTLPVRAPSPQGVTQDVWFTALHKSADAPDMIRPALYYQDGQDGARPSVSVCSDNQMPVPALNPSGKPAVMSRQPHFLGQQQVGWVNVTQSYGWWR